MKQVMKQLGKVICYVLLFLGMQQIIGTIVGFVYGFQEGLRAAAAGVAVDAEALTLGLAEYMVENATWIVSISGVLTLLFLWIFFKIRKKKLSQESGIKSFDLRKAVPIALLGISFSVMVSMLLQILPIPEAVMESYAQSSDALVGGHIVMILLADIVIAPVTEEIVFRGLVLSRLHKAMPAWAAVGISSFLFGLMHGNPLWIAYAFVVGCLLALTALRFKSIVASLILHMAFNFAGVFLGMLPITEDMCLPIGISAAAVSAVLVCLVFRKGKEEADVITNKIQEGTI